jgi:hypothetical protein
MWAGFMWAGSKRQRLRRADPIAEGRCGRSLDPIIIAGFSDSFAAQELGFSDWSPSERQKKHSHPPEDTLRKNIPATDECGVKLYSTKEHQGPRVREAFVPA